MWTWIDTYPAKTRMKIQNCVGKESGLLSVVCCCLFPGLGERIHGSLPLDQGHVQSAISGVVW